MWNTMIPKDTEQILCAAIWYKDFSGKTKYQPVNIDKGIVLCGWRHGCIIEQMKAVGNKRTVRFGHDAAGESVQGFITSKNRFIDRHEAAELFAKNGFTPEFDQLYSEDLY